MYLYGRRWWWDEAPINSTAPSLGIRIAKDCLNLIDNLSEIQTLGTRGCQFVVTRGDIIDVLERPFFSDLRNVVGFSHNKLLSCQYVEVYSDQIVLVI